MKTCKCLNSCVLAHSVKFTLTKHIFLLFQVFVISELLSNGHNDSVARVCILFAHFAIAHFCASQDLQAAHAPN